MNRFYQVAALFLLAILSSCSSASKHELKIAKINLKDDPNTLDPAIARSLNDLTIAKMFFEGLTRIGAQEEPELALARSVEISADLQTYTFELNDAKWTNGDPVTAGDFIEAWQRALNPTFNSAYASQLYCIKNARAIKEGKAKAEELGARMLNAKTLLVELEYPVPFFLKLVAMPIFFPHNPKANLDGVKKFICNGPFHPKEWIHSDRLVAEKNATYWDAEHVKLDGIEMAMVPEDAELQLFERKELHWAGSPLSRLPLDALRHLKQTGNLHVKPMLGTTFIRLNVERAPLDHPTLRRAFALAIERQELVKHVTQGEQTPATGIVPVAFSLNEEPYFRDGDIEEARALFERGLNELGLTRENFPKVTLTYAALDHNHKIVQALQEEWRKAFGITVALEAVEMKVIYSRLAKHDFEMALGSWIADFDDPINFLELFKYKSIGTNNTQWEDRSFRELVDVSFQCMDNKERYRILADCEKILIDAMPVIPIYHSSMLYLNDSHLQGVVLTGLGSLDFKWAELKE